MANAKLYSSTRICEGCGKVMVNVYHARRFCPACAEERHRARTAAWWTSHSDAIRSLRPKEETSAQRIKNTEERDAAFRADCRAADAAWLSYGQYMLLKNKQACPCANTDKPKG